MQPCDGGPRREGLEGMVTAAVELARCYACGESKPVGEFYRDSSKAAGRMARCKAFDLDKCRRYYAENRERILARHEPVPSREAVCVGCGESFMAKGRQRYCHPSCRPTADRGAKVEAVCDYCGRDFDARARDRVRGGGRFCGKSCSLRARSSPRLAVGDASAR